MTVSDIVTLVSLVIAIVAILNEKNRVHLLLKFHWFDYILLVGAFALINYFTFYDGFYARGFFIPQLYFHSPFTFNHPQNWAYVISISSLLFILWKILWAHYPVGKEEKVMLYYKKLIEINEIPLLLDLIDRYHKRDIIRLIKSSKNYDPNKTWWRERYQRVPLKQKIYNKLSHICFRIFRYSWYNRRSLAFSTLHGIMNDPAFIIFASTQRPYLFADIIAQFKKNKRGNFPEGLVNSFLTELINSKNFWLRRELQESQNFDSGQPEWFHDQNRILSSLFKDLSVAEVNEVWKAFGDCAIAEIEDERAKGYESKMFEECRGELHMWEYRSTYAIQFFKVLLIEALIQKYQRTHFFLFYYHYITSAILETLKKFPPKENKQNIHFTLLEEMTDNLFLWLRISDEKENNSLYPNILDCLGQIIEELCESEQYDEEKKSKLIERLLDHYCNLNNSVHVNQYREKIEQILLKPTLGIDSDHSYYQSVATAWDEFDKVPHRSLNTDYDYFVRMKEKIITPLGLDANKLY